MLVDSRHNLLDAYRYTCAKLRLEPDEGAFSQLIGGELESIFRALHKEIDLGTALDCFRARSRLESKSLTAFPGSIALVGLACQATQFVACVTSKDAVRARESLEVCGFPNLSIYSPSLGLPAKPEPELLLKAIADLGSGPACFFGDTKVDEASARSAGVEFIRCGWGFGDWDSGSDSSVPNAEEAFVWLQNWLNALDKP